MNLAIAREAGLRRVVVGLPRWASRLQAGVMDFVPGKPFSTDNYLSLTVDSVCTRDGMAALGIRPRGFGTALAGALAPLLNRDPLDSARRRAGRSGS